MQLSKWFYVFSAICLLASGGCGNSDSGGVDMDADLVSELLGPEDEFADSKTNDSADSNAGQSNGSDAFGVRTASNSSESRKPVRNKTAPLGEKLELRLREGDRFPLVKTIEQTLVQRSDVAPAMAQTKLELTLIITVEEVKSDAIRLGVRYSRVSYQHDVNGQRLNYDSASHQGAVPWDAIPYAGMINNGFSFWLGRNNSIREVVGYRDFLERCVTNVPLQRRESLLSEISNRFGDDGVANFVDDTIGLLPYDSTVDAEAATRVLPGDVWTRERRLMQPVPVHLTSSYRLLSLKPDVAEIEITGRIATGEAGSPSETGRLRILGGQSLGRCVVDRATGLPLEMNLTRFMKMQLITSDNQSVIQEKQIATTVRAFPEMRGLSVDVPQTNSGIQPAGGTRTQQEFVQPIPTQGNNAGPVRAVYPD